MTFCAGEFDMRVKSCSANAENSQPIQLSDEHGCVLRPKMISKFMKIAGADTRASVVTYAFFHAFKFPDSMAVNIKCKVRSDPLSQPSLPTFLDSHHPPSICKDAIEQNTQSWSLDISFDSANLNLPHNKMTESYIWK